jgi:site-specific DNA-cytosine methylase
VPVFPDVRRLDGGALERLGRIDLIAGGFPCQDISLAGNGAGLDGDRSGLWHEMRRVVGIVRPDWVLVENVPALRTRGADVVLDGLATEGYAAWPFVVGALHAGAEHRRLRVWIIAARRALVADGNGDGRERLRLRDPIDRERSSRWYDANGCGSRAMGDSALSRLAIGPGETETRGRRVSRRAGDSSGEPEAMGDADDRGRRSGILQPEAAPHLDGRRDAATQRAGDPTIDRGSVAPPGADQKGWELPRLVEVNAADADDVEAGPLNPGWVGQLMGAPDGWLDAPHAEQATLFDVGPRPDPPSVRRAKLRAWGNAVYAPLVAELGRAIVALREELGK